MRVDANAAQSETRPPPVGQLGFERRCARPRTRAARRSARPVGAFTCSSRIHPFPACLRRSADVDPRARRSSIRESRRPCLASIPRPDPSTPG